MSKLYMIDVEYFMVAAACFLTLYCIVLKRDPEPFQSIINKHKRNARRAYEKREKFDIHKYQTKAQNRWFIILLYVNGYFRYYKKISTKY